MRSQRPKAASDPDCLAGQPCLLGQMAAGLSASFAFGLLGAFLGGTQSPAQVLGQVIGAGAGVHTMSEVKSGVTEWSPSVAFKTCKSTPNRLAIACGGAAAASLVTAFLFAADLDFVVFSSALMSSLGAALATLLAAPSGMSNVPDTPSFVDRQDSSHPPVQISSMMPTGEDLVEDA